MADASPADESLTDDGPADEDLADESSADDSSGVDSPADDGPVDDSSIADRPTDGVQADSGGAGKDHQVAVVSLEQDGQKLDLNSERVDSNGDKDGDAEPIVPGAKQSGDSIVGNLGDVFHDSVAGMTLHEEPAGGDAGDFLLS